MVPPPTASNDEEIVLKISQYQAELYQEKLMKLQSHISDLERKIADLEKINEQRASEMHEVAMGSYQAIMSSQRSGSDGKIREETRKRKKRH